MNEISLYYSSGSKVEQTFSGQARKSIGGIITDIKVPQNLNALFGKISLKSLNEGSEDYRMVFLKNDGATGTPAAASTGTITITDNANITLDTISIGGVDLVEGTDFAAGGTAGDTAAAIKVAIDGNGTLNVLVDITVNGNIITVTAQTGGTGGDAITLGYTDSGSGVAVSLSGATLTGGVDAVLDADISLLNLYTDVPLLAVVTDPVDLAPPPVSGDKWIVPSGAEGDWFLADTDNATINVYEGKKATYDGAAWVFTFAPFTSFEYGFVAPIDISIGDKQDQLLPESFVAVTENVFEPPYGVEFLDADGVADKIQIGDGNLVIGKKIGMWIKRIVNPFRIESRDLVTDEGGIVLDEVTPMVFAYDTP